MSSPLPLLAIRRISNQTLRGRILTAIYALHWSSDLCNLAQFVYEVDETDCFIWMEGTRLYDCRECQLVERPEAGARVNRIVYDDATASQILGKRIVDILMPIVEDERHPDSYIIELSSGLRLAQVSGEPMGILPAVYVSEIDQAEMVSLFTE